MRLLISVFVLLPNSGCIVVSMAPPLGERDDAPHLLPQGLMLNCTASTRL